MWIVSIEILVTSKIATSYGPAVAAAGFLYAVLAGVFRMGLPPRKAIQRIGGIGGIGGAPHWLKSAREDQCG
jgi:hypothetical protein